MLDAIMDKLGPDLAGEVGITLGRLHIRPSEVGAQVRIAASDCPTERDGVWLSAAGLRDWAKVLTAVADVLDAADATVEPDGAGGHREETAAAG